MGAPAGVSSSEPVAFGRQPETPVLAHTGYVGYSVQREATEAPVQSVRLNGDRPCSQVRGGTFPNSVTWSKLSSMSPSKPTPDKDELYDEEYYECRYGARPSTKGDPEWVAFYDQLAANIVSTLAPRMVFDAGCGVGSLIEALWDRSVEAHGRDISRLAIEQVRPDVRALCSVGSIADPIEGKYDLITCIGVTEHMDEENAIRAICQITESSPKVLFSSVSADCSDPTHIKGRPPLYWLRQFADRGFKPALSYDATFVSPWAILFERTTEAISDFELVAAAELVRVRVMRHQEEARALAAETRNAELVAHATELESQVPKIEILEAKIVAAERDRDLDLVALSRQIDATEKVQQRADALERELQAQRAWEAEGQLQMIRGRTIWPLSFSIRRLASLLPPSAQRNLRRARQSLCKGSVITGSRAPPGAMGATDYKEALEPPSGRNTGYSGRFTSQLSGARTSLCVPISRRVTNRQRRDRLGFSGIFYGGVATASILSALLAARLGARLRVITRTEHGDAARIAILTC